jgi:DNA repair protein SbcC/Rad50
MHVNESFQVDKYLRIEKDAQLDKLYSEIEQIKDEHCLYNIAIGSSNIDVAVYVIHRISDLALLAKIKNYAKNKHKKLYQQVSQRIKTLKQEQKKHVFEDQEYNQLLQQLKKLTHQEQITQEIIVRYKELYIQISVLAKDSDKQKHLGILSTTFEERITAYAQQQELEYALEQKLQAQQQAKNALQDFYIQLQNPASKDSITKRDLEQQLERADKTHQEIGGIKNSSFYKTLLSILDVINRLEQLENPPQLEEIRNITIKSIEAEGVQHWSVIHSFAQSIQQELKTLENIYLQNNLVYLAHDLSKIANLLPQVTKIQNISRSKIRHNIKSTIAALEDKNLLIANNKWDTVNKLATKFLPEQANNILHKYSYVADSLIELKKVQDFVLLPKQQELCEQMAKLIGVSMPIKELSAAIKNLQHKWQQISRGSLSSDAIWLKFKELSAKAYAPCKEHTHKIKEAKANSLSICIDLCNKLEKLYYETDWQKVNYKDINKIYYAAITEWRLCKKLNYKKVSALQDRFDIILAKIDTELDKYYLKNAQYKKQLIQSAKDLIEKKPSNVLTLIKELQKRWRLTSPARRDEERELWQEFRQVLQPFFDENNASNNAKQQQYKDERKKVANVFSKMELMKQNIAENTTLELQTLLKEVQPILVSLSEKDFKFWDNKIAYLSKDINKLVENFKCTQELTYKELFIKLFASLVEIEKLLLENSYTGAQNSLSLIDTSGLKDKKLASLLQTRVCVIQKVIEATKNNTVDSSNIDVARLLCVRIELMLGIDTPDIDKNLRMEYQIKNMAKTMQFNIENADSRLATFNLVLELVSLNLLGSQGAVAISERCLSYLQYMHKNNLL